MITAPEGFRHHVQLVIRYGDLDRLSHVNNAKYLTYIEYGRLRYFVDLGLWHGGIAEKGVIVARITMDYNLPLKMDDGTVDVYSRCVRMGNKSFDIESLIVRSRDGAVAGAGTTTVVAYDYGAEKTIVVPDDWRKIISDYEPAL
jgi:acyl-CoA thioester hydrolase